MSSPHMKSETSILHIAMEGNVSQNFDLGLRLDFIDFRKKNDSKYHRKLTVLLNEIKTKP